MSSPGRNALPPVHRRPRARKSIAHPTDLGQENTAPVNFPTDLLGSAQEHVGSKKSRSKSLGPGGLDALKETSGNRRRSAANSVQPKSILKPTVPLSPIRAIPTRQTSRGQESNTSLSGSPAKQDVANGSERVPDTPARNNHEDSKPSAETSVEVDARHDELVEDRTAADRRKRKAEIQKQRDARRKSMAGRRVSFAPEATLHTWDTEALQDSTTSTGEADSTRRGSSFSESQGSAGDRPGTPPEQVNVDNSKKSPEHQRDAHKKHRRRSSGIPPMNFNDPHVLSSSPFSPSSAMGDDVDATHESINEGVASLSPSKSRAGPNEDLNMEGGSDPTKEEEDLDASLEDAAKRAGTRTLDLDENGDVSMDIAGDDVTAAFKPWVKQSMGTGSPHPGKAAAKMDQKNANILSPSSAAERGSPTPSHGSGEDLSMDMTQAVGGILPGEPTGTAQPEERYPRRRKSLAQRRRSSGEGSDMGGGTMDLTAAFGGVQKANHLEDVDPNMIDENEELSMEFTSVFGGVKGGKSPMKKDSQTENEQLGGIRRRSDEHSHDAENEDDDHMEMTEAVGSIQTTQGTPSRAVTEGSKPDVETASSSLLSKPAPRPRPSVGATATGSPAGDPFARRDRLRRSGNAPSTATPERKPATPTKQLTPVIATGRPTTPGKTPPSSAVAMRKTTPKKLFQEEIRHNQSPKNASPALIGKDDQRAPTAVSPRKSNNKRTSLLATEQANPGSPRMAAILDRRSSISDNADIFAPKGPARGVKFEDPRAMEAEVSKEREEEYRRESGQFIMEQEADGDAEEENATQNLKDLMHSMTPKKNKLKGRKSLAVGSAKGVLGKRPAELDDDEMSPQTFGKPSSPVKRIRLHGPPSAEETMRSSRNGERPMSRISGNARPETPHLGFSSGQMSASTPKSQDRFRDAEQGHGAQSPVPMMGQAAPGDAENIVKDSTVEQIGLQDFLNLTNVRFMELTTTKRRPTAAPANFMNGNKQDEDADETPSKRFEDSVVAGACTIPMLELFQHSCRELKKYISEGRSVVKEIEAETFEENPPVFREYTAAKPGERAALDNRFKIMKTNARLLSKATWYEWRMKLLDGVRESLKDTTHGLREDDDALNRQLSATETALQHGREQHAALQREHDILQQRADELAGCDPEDLELARQRLQSITSEIETISHGLEEHIESIQDLDKEIEAARQAKQAAQSATKEAQRQREECRGWSAAEVKKAQARVDDLVASCGWRILSTNGTQLTLEMDNELSLSFDTAAYLPNANKTVSPSLSLAYSPKQISATSSDPSTTQRFFLQLLRAHLHSLAPNETHASVLLQVVSSGWELAHLLETELKQLRRRCGITSEQIAGDEKLTVDTSLLLPPSQSKVGIRFTVVAAARGEKIEAGVSVSANCVYGKEFKKPDMDKMLQRRTGKGLRDVEEKPGSWAEAVEALKSWSLKA